MQVTEIHYIPYAELNDEQRREVDSPDYETRAAAAFMGYGLDKLVDDESRWVRGATAGESLSFLIARKKLVEKFKIKEEELKRMLCSNCPCPPQILEKLANDEDKLVREGLARNPNCTRDTFIKLANDEDWIVRTVLALNPKIPEEAIMVLANDEKWIVRYNLYEKNPACPPEIKLALLLREFYDAHKNW